LSACGNEEHLLSTICHSFRSHLPLQLTAIKAALREGDAPRLREAAHKLSGIVAAFSTTVAALALQLEDQAAADQLEACQPIISEIDESIQNLFQEMDGLTIEALRKRASSQLI
jgi:HPt (histidine-containing phosphotransfer) domain-containing protein